MLTPEINFVLQLITLVVLSVGVREAKRKRNFTQHGNLMIIAVVLNLLSFFMVMGPSLVGLQTFVLTQPLNTRSIVTVVHAGLGAIAALLGTGVVGAWRFRSPKYCVEKKKIMQATIVVWLTALISGFLLYALLYLT